MKIKLHHTPYVSRKISRDLVNCDFVEIRKTKDHIASEVQRILDEDIQNELDLDEKITQLLEEEEDNIEFYNADYRQLFWMAKKKIAHEVGVILNHEERFSDIAHQVLDYLWEEDFIHYTVSDNKVKNIIFDSIGGFLQSFEEADQVVYEKIKHYKRKLIPGTEEYDLVYKRLYEEELIQKGLM